jgi:hypothetical protein
MPTADDPSPEDLEHHFRKRRMESGWQDAWLDAPSELVVGCVLLVLSGIYWWTGAGPIWQDWQTALSTVAVVLGPWFVYRAWKRH